jgi:hypothetical protein
MLGMGAGSAMLLPWHRRVSSRHPLLRLLLVGTVTFLGCATIWCVTGFVENARELCALKDITRHHMVKMGMDAQELPRDLTPQSHHWSSPPQERSQPSHIDNSAQGRGAENSGSWDRLNAAIDRKLVQIRHLRLAQLDQMKPKHKQSQKPCEGSNRDCDTDEDQRQEYIPSVAFRDIAANNVSQDTFALVCVQHIVGARAKCFFFSSFTVCSCHSSSYTSRCVIAIASDCV